MHYICWHGDGCGTPVWGQCCSLSISGALASPPVLMCFRLVGTVLFLWISLWVLDRILAGEGASVLAGHVRNAVWREDARSPPAFAWGLPG